MDRQKRTRVICTLGPSCWSVDMLGALIDNGMNVARLNFSHGDHNTHKDTLIRLEEALAKRPSKHCAVMLDTKGPEIRTGFFAPPNEDGKIRFCKGQELVLTTDYDYKSDGSKLSCTYEHLPEAVSPNTQILVADGSLVLEVVSKCLTKREVTCKVMNTCSIGERKNMNLPGVRIDLPVLQKKDIDDLVNFACVYNVDIVAASFVQSSDDVKYIRKTLDDAGGQNIRIISKIENQEGIENIQSILAETDGIMVARGDLGMEIPPEKVFREQKKMIALCARVGKPVIVATQMLESMCVNPRPTRAECSDVANAVLDGTDAVMLSGETAGGLFPIEAVSMMSRICIQAEDEFDYEAYNIKTRSKRPDTISIIESTVSAAAQAARDVGAKAIIVLAVTGATAQLFSKYKCGIPIIVATAYPTVARYCQGVIPGSYALYIPELSNYGYSKDAGDDEHAIVSKARKYAFEMGLVSDDTDVLCAVHSYRTETTKNIVMRFLNAGV